MSSIFNNDGWNPSSFSFLFIIKKIAQNYDVIISLGNIRYYGKIVCLFTKRYYSVCISLVEIALKISKFYHESYSMHSTKGWLI